MKSCGEKKRLDHCGQCPDFPCEALADMGKEEGYDSTAKIRQCRMWVREETAESVSSMTTLGILQ